MPANSPASNPSSIDYMIHSSASKLATGLFLFSAISAAAGSPAWLRAHDAEIKSLVGRMTLEEKVGQMTQPDCGSLKDPADIGDLFLGSVLSGGTSDPATGNEVKDWAANYEACQRRALGTRLRIPLLYGVDAVHGHNNVLGAVIFPHQIGLGCTRNPALVERIAQVTAREVRATGIQWSFAPCLAVARDLRWGRTYESFSSDPAVVAELGVAAVRGLQGVTPGGGASVAACAKHFVGDGGTAAKMDDGRVFLDQGDTRVDEATLREIHLAGYPPAIDAGVMTIMPSFSSWNGVKCSASKYLLTDLLKHELGFDGFLISDYNAIDQIVPPSASSSAPAAGNNASGQVVSPDYKKCIEISINAGMDMVMISGRHREFIAGLKELVHEGKIPVERIDDAVTRILRVKFAMGMMAADADLMPSAALQREFGSKEHREIARQAVRESLVILKNSGSVLPISKSIGHIHVSGRAADDIGIQCGGWTIDWQGKPGPVTSGGTTVLAAIKQAAGRNTRITSSPDGTGAHGADLAVAVVGELPYAEMLGDHASPSLAKEDLAVIESLKASGVPVVVIVISGRPLLLGKVASEAEAIVAAWLPGTEGLGITDVLFGDHPAKGRLSFAWPRDDGALLFPFGHGLDGRERSDSGEKQSP